MRAIVDQSQLVSHASESRKNLSAELNDYFEELKGYCPTHFGRRILSHRVDFQCDRHNDYANRTRYPDFRNAFKFCAYTYCFACGAPNDSPDNNFFPLACHPFPVRGSCKWAHFVYRNILAVWHRLDVAPVLCEITGAPVRNLDNFTSWAKMGPSGSLAGEYFNGLRFFMEYCRTQTNEDGVLHHLGLNLDDLMENLLSTIHRAPLLLLKNLFIIVVL